MYKIMGKYRGESEEIDEADDKQTAEYLVGEYQLAYGREWRVWAARSRTGEWHGRS